MDKKVLIKKIEHLSIPQKVKKELIFNADIIDEDDLLDIVDEYTLDFADSDSDDAYLFVNNRFDSFDDFDYEDGESDANYNFY